MSCGGRPLPIVNKLVEYSSNMCEIELPACTTEPTKHQCRSSVFRPSGSRVMAAQSIATFSSAHLAWRQGWLL